MAVSLVTTVKRFIGTAAEIAAFDLTGIPIGSTFLESDTGILKVLNAAGALVTAPSETVTAVLGAGTALAGKIVPVDTDGDEKFITANPAVMQLSGSKAQEPFSDSVSKTVTFSKTMLGFVIYNDNDSANLTFVVGTSTFTVPPKMTFDERLPDFTQVVITATGNYYGYARGN